jgi:glycosyltransferase involved in cell wall biosynthesis
MNKGLRIASGDIIGFLNADDIFAGPDIIMDVVQLMENSGKDAIFGDLVYVSPKNPEKIVRYYDSSGFKEKWLSMGSMPAHPTLYLNRNVYDKFGYYRTDYKIAADFEFITRIFHNNHNSYAYLPKIMVRMNMGGISTRNLYSNYVLNKEMLRACRENNISTNIVKLLLKYPKKFAGVIKARKIQSVR